MNACRSSGLQQGESLCGLCQVSKLLSLAILPSCQHQTWTRATRSLYPSARSVATTETTQCVKMMWCNIHLSTFWQPTVHSPWLDFCLDSEEIISPFVNSSDNCSDNYGTSNCSTQIVVKNHDVVVAVHVRSIWLPWWLTTIGITIIRSSASPGIWIQKLWIKVFRFHQGLCSLPKATHSKLHVRVYARALHDPTWQRACLQGAGEVSETKGVTCLCGLSEDFVVHRTVNKKSTLKVSGGVKGWASVEKQVAPPSHVTGCWRTRTTPSLPHQPLLQLPCVRVCALLHLHYKNSR